MTIELTGQPSQPSEVLGGPLPSITTERRIAAAPTRHDVRPLLDQEFARCEQAPPAAESPFSKVHWTYLEALSWVLYRDPDRFGSIDIYEFRRLNWYNPTFQACCKAFRRECELGNVKGFRNGVPMTPAEWKYLDASKDPDIVLAAVGILSRWPAAGSKDDGRGPAADAGDRIVRCDDNTFWKKLIAEQVKADAMKAPSVPVDDLSGEQINNISKQDQDARTKAQARLNGRGKDGVVTRIKMSHPELKQDDGEATWDEMFPDWKATGQGRRSGKALKTLEAMADDWLRRLAA